MEDLGIYSSEMNVFKDFGQVFPVENSLIGISILKLYIALILLRAYSESIVYCILFIQYSYVLSTSVLFFFHI